MTDVDDLPDEYYVLKMKDGGGFWLGHDAGTGLKQFIGNLRTGDELLSYSLTDLSGSSIIIMAGSISDLYYSSPETRELDKALMDRDYPKEERPF